ncbi:MAG: aminotransferase class III-fold pyridoxal phosphate-dependent enzyme [Alphaproteobacteria bacterium]|nr:aminotransferase class III-fold pyridoxal phosphate-dependent enzyme [Alphaproteobacteria bacterium]
MHEGAAPLGGFDGMTQGGNGARLDAYWMPFTANRDFRARPRVVVGAEGHSYRAADGRRLYDIFSGLWTTGAGHCHPKIVEAVSAQARSLDFAMNFQMANDKAIALAHELVGLAPAGFASAFFTNSGSEAADTALKIALAYHRARGEAGRTRFIGRERGYHGVNFGGLAVGGIGPNRRVASAALPPGVDHLPDTLDLSRNGFSRGLPAAGAERADELERLCALHGPENIAAVIVEPVAGSTGVLPPPVGYLERLREICSRHGVLLIFDEVITAFGRVGAAFAAERLGVVPDIITIAKGVTNGVIPMGGALVSQRIVDAVLQGPEYGVEFFHGYTYSGHPIAAAAGLATLSVYREEGLFETARALAPAFEDALHAFRDHPKVRDVRNFGLMGAIELEPRAGSPGLRGLEVHKACFWEEDLVLRNGMDILQFAPFLNARETDIFAAFDAVRRVLDRIE